jgi:hypothetical protein
VNAVIVLTARVENAPGDISSAQLVHELSQLYNRRQRIQIIVIMLGQAGNFPMLQQVAAATHGKAYQVTQPTVREVTRVHAVTWVPGPACTPPARLSRRSARSGAVTAAAALLGPACIRRLGARSPRPSL